MTAPNVQPGNGAQSSHDSHGRVDTAILVRVRERSARILGQNASNTAKALAKDALALCAIIDNFQAKARDGK